MDGLRIEGLLCLHNVYVLVALNVNWNSEVKTKHDKDVKYSKYICFYHSKVDNRGFEFFFM